MEFVLQTFLLINAIFWGLFPHQAHCKVLSDINKLIGSSIKCPSHSIHLIMGVAFFLAAVAYTHRKYLSNQI